MSNLPTEPLRNKDIFWLDRFNGTAKGGYYYRSNLFEMFKKFEKDCGKKIVGIVKPNIDDWNVELILEDIPDVIDHEGEL